MPTARRSSTTTLSAPSPRPSRARSGCRSRSDIEADMIMMKRSSLWLALTAVLALPCLAQTPLGGAVDNHAAPLIPFHAVDFIQTRPGQKLGEGLGVAVSSKGHVVILNHPGTATTGPLYGNATTEIL